MRRVAFLSHIVAASSLLLFVFLGVAEAQLTPEQQLGNALYFDVNLSINRNQSCASCHDPLTGFVDPDNTSPNPVPPPAFFPVSEGSVAGLFGGLNAPSAAYAAFSPFFHWDGVEGLYVGGQFWNGRANTLAEQAAGPPLNPVEMAMPDKWSVVARLQENPAYIAAFSAVYGLDLEAIAPYDPTQPTPPGVLEVYDRMAKAIGEFEKTELFTPFDSKFDYFLAGRVTLTKQEEKGLKLFNQQGKCNLCHLSAGTIAPDGVSVIPPLFTDFTYDNLGLPQNLYIPGQPIDPGLGGREDIADKDPLGLQLGKHKVMTLRNIELTPPYGHNGVFQSLKEIVHFYNTRDVLPPCDPALGNTDPGFALTCWPAPEVPQNVNVDELGALRLTSEQEDDIVAFLLTLTDGWGPANGMPPLPRPPMPPFP